MNTMSMDETTKVIPSAGVDPEVTAYVGLVRTALRDLSSEDLDDLTGGLEADLAEVAAESEEPLIARLGEPSVYAAELRSAAGFPPAAYAEEPKVSRLTRMRESWERAKTEHPWLQQLRPVWWVLRGVVLTSVLFSLLVLRNWVPVVLLGAALSFWAGLQTDGWSGWRTRAVTVSNILAAVLVLPFAVMLAERPNSYVSYAEVEVAPESGVYVDGELAENFYVYDGAGQRVDGARIYNHAGTLLRVDPWTFYDGDGAEPDGLISVFPIAHDIYDAWDTTRGHTPGHWIPPLTIPPAFPAESAQTPTASPTDDATSPAEKEPGAEVSEGTPTTSPTTPSPTATR